MNQPLIGLPGRRRKGRDIEGAHAVLDDVDVDIYFADYARGVIDAGGLAVHIPVDVDPAELVSRVDGILLPGGTDIDPDRYGAQPHTELWKIEPGRDEFEFAVLDAALDAEVPVLGICRGLQLLNVFDGGTLNQHVAPHARFDTAPHTEHHRVEFKDGSILHRLYGPTREVNTLHHQTIDRPGPNITVTAISDDGEVEGIEHRSADMVAVQWHPELLTSRAQDPIFGWLIDKATARAAS